jgi:hypothetical protein
MQLDPTAVLSALIGCATGYAAIKVEIKFLWRDIRELKKQVAELSKKAA